MFFVVLRLIKDVQQQHGLRHGDYQRYRGYCTRRIGRLRKVLKLPQGDKKHYKKRDVLLNHLNGPAADERFLHIPLFMAERAWSYGMQLRQEANSDRRKKFHLINKLRKACGYALHFQELCNVSSTIQKPKTPDKGFLLVFFREHRFVMLEPSLKLKRMLHGCMEPCILNCQCGKVQRKI